MVPDRQRRCVWWLLALMLLAAAPALPAATPVFRDGHTMLPILVAADAAPMVRTAAEDFARVLAKMSGFAWPVRSPSSPGEAGFYVGSSIGVVHGLPELTAAKDLLAPQPGEIGPDGFRIETRDGSVIIEGATPEATGFAVSWLLQYAAGVRWYAPGEEGEIVPRRSEWSVPELHVIREPAYVSREITGLKTPAEIEWARHNGLRSHLEFSHALDSVFPPETLSAHPDWLPLLQGQRYQPSSVSDHNWQPNLALPEVAGHAARVAAAAFARDPDRVSFSLGMNDTCRFDQSTASRTLVEPLRYFRGMPDYSPLVFTFMNRAAESVAATNPGHYLGCLAYFWCENPPPFPVNSRVVPFVTTDRSQYYDREYRRADLALMARWGASGVKAFGLWEYAYGRGFLVPREPLTALAESIRVGWHSGARGYLAELEPHGGFDTFKAWMIAQLLWEPDRPLKELADDFYRGYYGAAAQPMRRFFERCEARWMAQAGSPCWLKLYQQEDQSLLFPPETCREIRALIDDAARLATGDATVAARVERTMRAFAVTETYVAFDTARRELTARVTDGGQLDEGVSATLIQTLLNTKSRFTEAFGAATKGERPAMTPMELAPFFRNDPVPALLWRVAQRDVLAARRVLGAAGLAAGAHESWHAMAGALADGRGRRGRNLVENGSFELRGTEAQQPPFLFPRPGEQPTGWEVMATPTETGRVAVVETEESSRRMLRVEGAWDTMVYQWVPAKPGRTYVVTAQLRGSSSPGNESALYVRFLSVEGKVLDTIAMQSLATGRTSAWRTLSLAEVAPMTAAWVGVGIGAARQSPGDWLEAGKVELHGVRSSASP